MQNIELVLAFIGCLFLIWMSPEIILALALLLIFAFCAIVVMPVVCLGLIIGAIGEFMSIEASI